MAIITKPGTITKGVDNAMQLSKANLALQSKVAADPYFNQQSNWNKVILMYASVDGGQDAVVAFDATQASPAANFKVSNKARNQFNIVKLVIQDFDNGELTLKRSDLVPAEFDITMV
jgi:hypothetical protein